MHEKPIDRILRPFERFTRLEASSGILLLICTAISLAAANSPWAADFHSVWKLDIGVAIGSFGLSKPLLLWINDGLMAVFFFVIGLEIKREVMEGELASLRRSALPIVVAVAGMVVPAAIYLTLNSGLDGMSGWGVPMATDIAFAVGILALLGKRVPPGLKVFLVAIAIVDDLGAVLVIAIFYTDAISWPALGVAAVLFALLLLANVSGVRRISMYAVLGIGLWVAFLKSGVHATIAGVLLAMTIPAARRIDQQRFLESARRILGRFSSDTNMQDPNVTADQQTALFEFEELSANVESPSKRLEHELHPWVSFGIMPVFALANAGVSLRGDPLSALSNPITLGVMLGLVLGKQIGITLSSWILVKLGVVKLPANTTMRQLYGVAWLGGIGFTMSLFVASLAFQQESALYSAKLGILLASVMAGVVGYVILRSSSDASGSPRD